MEKVNGRVTNIRKTKSQTFLDVATATSSIQAVVDGTYFSNHRLKRGDIVAVQGKWEENSQRVTPSLLVEGYVLLVRPFKYLKDDGELKELTVSRANLDRVVRECLTTRGLVEVQSPILSESPGCSNITPFKTTHYQTPYFLRFTMDLELRKYVCRTQLPVFEIGKVFRNMGRSKRHCKEYSVVEAFIPYANLQDGIKVVEQVISCAAEKFTVPSSAMNHMTVADACSCFSQHVSNDPDKLKQVYEEQVKKQQGPVFVLYPPKSWSPLATHNENGTANDAELIYGRVGIAHVCEVNADYESVHSILLAQKNQLFSLRADVNVDERFLKEFENGMPPSVGFCIGLDRLLMVLLGKRNIQEVIPFTS